MPKAKSNDEGGGLPAELISCIFETMYLLRIVIQTGQRDQVKVAIEKIGLPYIYNADIEELARKNRSGR